MELTLDQALIKGVEAHKAGKAQEADRYYPAILKAQPKHPDANHNIGVLAVGIGKVQESLSFFKTALEVNPSIAQFWLSYIDALIKLNRMDDAKTVLDEAKSKGIKGDVIKPLSKKVISKSSDVKDPPQDQLQSLINHYTQGLFQKALTQGSQLLKDFPNSFNLYNIIGAANKSLGNLDKAIEAFNKALSLKPDYAEAYNNMAIALTDQGKIEEAIKAYSKALSLKPDYAEAYNNMGIALRYQGKLDEAIEAYNKALSLQPENTESYWNLYGTSGNIKAAKKWIEQCLKVDPNHEQAKLTLSALKFYEGDKSEFRALIKSPAKDHPYVRSFNWAFSLPKLPLLHFHRWSLFEHMIAQSRKDRPFYEFGVWRGEAFKYLIKTFKKGYGFDTFKGLPEDWHNEKTGSYSSEGNIPKVDGGEFIVGKFEDTLPDFFSETRPMASIINFDADLYSSTICALNYSKSVIDEHTILIFDEFIMNKNWEEDEYKALEEFCSNNHFEYEVLAISFFTAQVAVRLIAI